jgi:hypothetical protein
MRLINVFFSLIVLTTFSYSGYAQKVKFKKGDVLVDNVAWLKYDGCGTFDSTCSLMDFNGEELMFMKVVVVEGVNPPTKLNRQGDLTYKQITFLGLDRKIELQVSDKKVIEILYKAKILAGGKLDPDRVDILVEKYGTPFSDRFNR